MLIEKMGMRVVDTVVPDIVNILCGRFSISVDLSNSLVEFCITEVVDKSYR